MFNNIFKIYIFLLISLNSCNIFANIWDDLVNSTCGAFQNDIREEWGGNVKTFSPNRLCPPYNKEDGRSGTCLEQFDFPSTPNIYYFKVCAQATNQSSYFTPVITIVSQACNAGACWPFTQDLQGHGDCKIFPTPYGVPLTRMCGRIASPLVKSTKTGESDTPAEMGYTNDVHLNLKGEDEIDQLNKIFQNSNIKKEDYRRPKFCAYDDPSLITLDLGSIADPMDYNPTYQPLHKTDKLAPVARVLLLIIDVKLAISPAGLISKLMELLGVYNVPGLDVLQKIMEYVVILTNLFDSLFKEIIKSVGSLNGVVSSQIYGCVELPLGAMPPPYCPKLSIPTSMASVQKICTEKYPNSNIFRQDMTSNCVISKLQNNIINNVIRVSFDYDVRLCTNNEDPYKTDKCVGLQNIPAILSEYNDSVIPICNDSSDSRFCVKTSIKNAPKEVRLIYSRGTNKNSPTNYYVSYIDYPTKKMPDCTSAISANSGICQKIYGVNMNSYADIKLTYPYDQNQNKLTPISSDFLLTDISNGAQQRFTTRIVSVPTKFNDYEQKPSEICVYNFSDNSLVGCITRSMENYKITVSDCSQYNKFNVRSCYNNNYYTPQAILSIIADNYTTSTIIEPLSIHSNPTPQRGAIIPKIYLAGLSFSSQIIEQTEKTYNAMPYFGDRAFGPKTIFGIYENGAKPIDKNNKLTNAKYLNGLETKDGVYIQGASHICAIPENNNNSNTCLPGISDKNCVLTKLLNNDIVDCVDFNNIFKKYPNLTECSSLDANCSSIMGFGNFKIRECSSSNICYTGDFPKNICLVSYNPDDRIIPSKDLGPILSDSQFYKKDVYDDKKSAIRNKTEIERGLCTKILEAPTCKSIDLATDISGNATWPNTKIGEIATGQCKQDYQTTDGQPLQRYCLSKIETKSVEWDNIKNNATCVPINQVKISNIEHNFDTYFQDPNLPKDRPRINFTYSTPSQYDAKTKIGTFKFYLDQDKTNNADYSTGWDRRADFSFNINVTDISKLEYFKLKRILYDDYYVMSINAGVVSADPLEIYIPSLGNKIINDRSFDKNNFLMMGRTNVQMTPINTLDYMVRYFDTYKRHSRENIDLLPFLQNGKNPVDLHVFIVGGGKLEFDIEYKLK